MRAVSHDIISWHTDIDTYIFNHTHTHSSVSVHNIKLRNYDEDSAKIWCKQQVKSEQK